MCVGGGVMLVGVVYGGSDGVCGDVCVGGGVVVVGCGEDSGGSGGWGTGGGVVWGRNGGGGGVWRRIGCSDSGGGVCVGRVVVVDVVWLGVQWWKWWLGEW